MITRNSTVRYRATICQTGQARGAASGRLFLWRRLAEGPNSYSVPYLLVDVTVGARITVA